MPAPSKPASGKYAPGSAEHVKRNKQPTHMEHNPQDLESLERLRYQNHILWSELARSSPERARMDLESLVGAMSQESRHALEPLPEMLAYDRFQPRVGSWPNDNFRVRTVSPDCEARGSRSVIKQNKISRSRSPSPSESKVMRSCSPSPGRLMSSLGVSPEAGFGSPHGEGLEREDLISEICSESHRLQQNLRDAAEHFLRRHEELAQRALRGGRINVPNGNGNATPRLKPYIAGANMPHAAVPDSGQQAGRRREGPQILQEKTDPGDQTAAAEKRQPKQLGDRGGDEAEDYPERGDVEGGIEEKAVTLHKQSAQAEDCPETTCSGPFNTVESTRVSTATEIEESTITIAQKLEDIRRQKAREYGPWAVHVLNRIEQFERLQQSETDPDGPAAAFLLSNKFSAVTCLVILSNALFLAAWTDYSVTHPGSQPTIFMLIVEICFLMFYSFELVLRLYVRKLYFFFGYDWKWNLFDGIVVMISVAEMSMENMSSSEHSSSVANISFLRAWRLFKLARVLKVFKQWDSISEVRLMMEILVGSIPSLFWAVILLSFITFLFGVLFVQAVGSYLLEQPTTDTIPQGLLENFGSVRIAMVTLFEVVAGGNDWKEYYEMLVAISGTQGAIFLFYVAFFMIAVWNIMTSIFIDRTMKLAAPDMDNLIFEKSQRDAKDIADLMDLMNVLDSDHSSTVSFEEFLSYMADERFRLYFTIRGLDVKDTAKFFRMLQAITGKDTIDLKSFVKSCMKMKGTATSIDVQMLHFECKTMRHQLESLVESMETQITNISHMLRSK